MRLAGSVSVPSTHWVCGSWHTIQVYFLFPLNNTPIKIKWHRTSVTSHPSTHLRWSRGHPSPTTRPWPSCAGSYRPRPRLSMYKASFTFLCNLLIFEKK
ncbi:hypothetical protein BC828DRAFT_386714 [Blastocladiella britannica]|nr:hypothetical protein BC828DRAFT_386714 [Blastocladiella britannica]